MPQQLETVQEPPLSFEVKQESRSGVQSPVVINKAASAWLPINPARTPSGALVSLTKLLGEDKAHPLPLGENPDLSSFSVIASEVDLSVAAKLGIGNIFSGTLNYGDRAFYMDATAFTDVYTESPGTPICGTRWGVGLRVLLHVSEIKSGLTLNFGLVGAAVQLGFAKALYEIDGMGIKDGLSVVLGELHGFGDFTAETFYRINDSVIPKLADYMKNNASKLTPVPYQVQLIQPVEIDPILSAQSIIFGMRRLREGCSLNDALVKAAGKHDQNEIRATYEKMAPGLASDLRPPQSIRDAANEWLDDK
jgi:hypothetical protein